MNEAREKEKYRLNFEYLKQSAKYKDFSKWIYKRKWKDRKPVPERFLIHRESGQSCPMFLVYMKFGDISSYTFDEWWNSHGKQKVELMARITALEAVVDYKEVIKEDMEYYIESLKRLTGRTPSVEEFKEYFVGEFKEREELCFLVSPNIDKMSNLEKRLKEFLRERRKKTRDTIRTEELEKYLRVLELWGKIEPLEILYEIEPLRKKIKRKSDEEMLSTEEYDKKIKQEESERRLVYTWWEKGKRLVKNAEQGVFPGDYYS